MGSQGHKAAGDHHAADAQVCYFCLVKLGAVAPTFTQLTHAHHGARSDAGLWGPRATSPLATTMLPTPRSIRLLPYASHFARRRGKARKSTAKMAAHTQTSSMPRKSVTALQPRRQGRVAISKRKHHILVTLTASHLIKC